MAPLGRSLAFASLVAALAAAPFALVAADDGGAPGPLTERERALHVLNRLAFGPRPGDVDRVLATGVPAWIERQLHPNRIDDRATESLVAALPTVSMSRAELVARFEVPLVEARKRLKAEKASSAAADGGEDGARGGVEKLRDLLPPESRPGRILEELTEARLVRAVSSERQLDEVMVDFWMNHFNVYANKGLDRIYIASFERDTIRPRIWGRFEELLLATAQSPAMLVYLDNARSVADADHRPPSFGRFRNANPGKGPSGLNENYARELLELHTLGVEGGYSQQDVTELARVLTGWSVGLPRDASARPVNVFRHGPMRASEPEEPGAFVFRARLHDSGTKTVLGVRFPSGGGREEGEAALRMLARHPATAWHLATEICRRLVADDPPTELVQRVAARYLATGGDLTETVRAVVTSPEFFDPLFYRAKVKSPFEYAVSAVRAAGGETDGRALGRQVAAMGEPLYLCQPPTGYSDASETWINSGALVARLNFAIALTAGRIPGTPVDVRGLPSGSPGRGVQNGAFLLLGTDVSASTVQTISRRLADPEGTETTRELLAALLLGSPEFQRQ
jgi:uncharacterized protein (DUF1800 family)